MAAKKIIRLYVMLLCTIIGYSCTKKQGAYTDADMITLAEMYQELFREQDISCIQLRSNYYICNYNDSSSYLVSCNCKVVRNLNNHGEIISINAQNDTSLLDNIQMLITIVEDVSIHDIKFVEVDSSTIKIEKLDGYYLTNKPYSDNTLNTIQGGWYSNRE